MAEYKVKPVFIHQGQVTVQDVPAPQAREGQMLVEVAYSFLSGGTEPMDVRVSRVRFNR
ncbi:MAG: hypothetical protein ABIN58_01545 [candidate division WOR-3 bacterium]